MDELINYKCIDYKKLLLIKGKELNINDQESHILLIIMTMFELNIKPINPNTISRFSTMSLKEIDKLLLKLLNKHLLSRNNGYLSLEPLYSYLLKEEVTKEKEVNLYSLFEDAFGRSLSQGEVSIISSFKTNGFNDDMIIDALNEAVKSGVINFRYIEKILDNWKKYGVSKRFVRNESNEDDVSDDIKNYNWWNNNE